MASEGFIYVLSNKSMPGLVKIGKTTRSPINRAKELYTSGVLMPFHVEYAVYSPDVDTLEADIHDDLADQRESHSREFFRVDVAVAIQKLLRLTVVDLLLDVVPCEEVIETEDLLLCADKADVNPMMLSSMLPYISEEAWQESVAMYNATMEQRRANGCQAAAVGEFV